MNKFLAFLFLLIGSLSIAYAQPTNLDFSAGTLNGWTLQEGGNQSSLAKTISNIHPSTQYTVFTGPTTDVNAVPVSSVSPLGGNFIRIGNTTTGGSTYKLSQTFTIDASSSSLSFVYATVMDNGGHDCDQQNYFDFIVKDPVGNIIPSNSSNQSILNGTSCSSGDPSYATFTHFGYKDWTLLSYDLNAYIGTSVSVEVLVAGCNISQAAHAGYAYFDAAVCSNTTTPGSVTVNGNSYSLIQNNQTIDLCNTSSSVIWAPPGATTYSWSGGTINGLTTQSVSITQAGNYHLSCNRPFECSNTTEVNFRVGVTPTLAITGATNSACPGVNRQLTANGASSYIWSTVSGTFYNASVSSVYNVAPQVASVYNLVGKDIYGCTASLNYTASVLPSPTLSVSGSTLLCSPFDSAILTASGADTYTWSSGGVTTNTLFVLGAASTNYSVTGTLLSSGCSKTANHYITAGTSVTVTANKYNLCVGGDSTTAYASGATSYTWSNGVNSSSVTLSPTVTTTYTLSGMTGCGVKQATITLNVNPLPNLPISISPTICPGASNIYSTSSGLMSYTWSTGSTAYMGYLNPVNTGSSYTANISVTAKSNVGCVNSNSLTYTVYPSPNITFSLSNGICVGDTSLITASGASSYTWNPGNLTGSSIVSSSVSTNYSVVGVSSFGCSNTQSLSLGISPSLSLTTNASPSVTCSGKTTTLSVQGNGIMRWYVSDTASQFVSNALSYVTPTLSAGTYTYYVSSSCSGYLVRTPVVFIVSANPTIGIVASTTTVCANTSFQLIANGANTYTWTSGYPAYVNVVNDTIITSQASASTYSVRGVDNNGCVSSNTVLINVYPVAQVTVTALPFDVCVGSTSTLSLIGATSYTWSNGVVSTPAVITPTAYTSYSVNLINTYGCLQTNYAYVNIVQKPIISFGSSTSSLCAGSTGTLIASGAATYTWSSGAISPSVSVSPTITTSYSVTGSAAGLPGCLTTAIKTITVNALPNVKITSSKDTICKGNSVTLNATGASSYVWYDGTTSLVNYVTPAVTTSYSLVGTETNGCKSAHTKTIVVHAITQVTAVATPSAVCYGQPTTISAIGVSNYTVAGYGAPYSTPKIVYPQWTPPNTYGVNGTDSNGCSSYGTVTVNVDRSANFYTNFYSTSNTTSVCAGSNVNITTSTPTLSYVWLPSNLTTNSIAVTPSVSTIYTVTGTNVNCSYSNTVSVTVNPSPIVSVVSSGTLTCAAQPTLYAAASNSVTYAWYYPNGLGGLSNTGVTTNSFVPYNSSLSYSCYVTSTTNSCVAIATTTFASNNSQPIITYTAPNSVCHGSSAQILADGGVSYNLNYSGITANTVFVVSPTVTTTYTLVGIGSNSCTMVVYPQIVVDNTCQDVWPGDANSDGVADNLDVLELGLHYTQTGTPRATTSNVWQSYFANNWTGTITNGKNLNHSDCNGDGIIDDNDTLAVFNNYGLTHAFRPSIQMATVPQLVIVPNQSAVIKGAWGSASIYLGEPAMSVNDVNGIAFTVNFDNTLLEPNSIWIEYPASFINTANQNLHFRKLDFATSNLFTATTHTINNNVSGNGLVGILHYKILSSLTTDEVLNLNLVQGFKSEVSGQITQLTAGTGTLMALGSSVGLQELNGNVISISPNPTNGSLMINSKTELQKIEVVAITGQVLLSEVPTNVSHTLHLDNFANGIYFVNLYQKDRIVRREKVVLNK